MNLTHLSARNFPSFTTFALRIRPIRACLGILAVIAATGATRGLADEVVLYDQTATPSGILGSQNFLESDIDDCTAADDFVVPAGETWAVTGARILAGYYGANGPAVSFHVTIFSDSGTFPGSSVCDYPNLPYTTDGSSFHLEFPSTCSLPAGTYWLAVQANMSISLGTWVWTGSLTTVNSGCVWENPLDGFGTGATTFTRVTAFSPGNSPDLSFQILGSDCADLAISQKATQKVNDKGALHVTYTLKVKNFGPATGDSVEVSDFISAEATFVSATASQGSIEAPPVGYNGTVVCNLGSIPNGQTATITVTVKVKANAKKSVVNTATVGSHCDPEADNNSTTLAIPPPNK